MTSAPFIDAATLRLLLAEEREGALVEERWQCDVIEAHAPLIRMHNALKEQNGQLVEKKFANLSGNPLPLTELLWKDFAFLCRGNPNHLAHRDDYVFAEVSGPGPNAVVLELDNGKYVICFRSCLLAFLHTAFSKLWMLTSLSRCADCHPDHDHLLGSDDYSDEALLAGLLSDFEILFGKRLGDVSISPPHLADPFNYCERVEGVRRFILAHELAHTFSETDPARQAYVDMLVKNGATLDQIAASPAWFEETTADALAIWTLFEIYRPSVENSPQWYEMENAFTGILWYFVVMETVQEIISVIHELPPLKYPDWRLRASLMHQSIMSFASHRESDRLTKVLEYNWRMIHKWRAFLGGHVLFPDSIWHNPYVAGDSQRMWSDPRFTARLSAFGRRVLPIIENRLHREQSGRDGETYLMARHFGFV